MTVVLNIKVVPQSGRHELVWSQKQQIILCYVKAAPEKNKANEEIFRLLRKTLGSVVHDIVIIGGHAARRKTVRITTELTKTELLQHTGIDEVGQQSVW